MTKGWKPWLRNIIKEGCALPGTPKLGALTGQDEQALAAIANCWKLYARGDETASAAALVAIRALLPAMQPHTRPLARELIPWALDWHDRETLWPIVSGE